MIEIDIQKTALKYVAEGNANIVLKMLDCEKVLRLPKSLKKSKNNEDSKLLSYLQQCRKYAHLLASVLGAQYINIPEVLEVSVSQRNLLNAFLAEFRPKNRLEKEFDSNYALLIADATSLNNRPTLAIEIKPKQGWTFDNSLKSIFNQQCFEKCRSCYMQFLKIKSGKVSSISKYCPIDLFSGNKHRMHMAIMALLEKPQNNLRIFDNGDLIYGEGQSQSNNFETTCGNFTTSEISMLILGALLDEDVSQKNFTEGVNNYSQCCPESNLTETSILKSILDLQLLSKIHMKFMSKQQSNDIKSYEILQKVVSRDSPLDIATLSPEEQYMIGATFMDVSVMITISAGAKYNVISDTSENVRNICGKRYIIKLTVLDLDPKPDNHIQKYIKQTKDAHAAYLRSCSIDSM